MNVFTSCCIGDWVSSYIFADGDVSSCLRMGADVDQIELCLAG